jgi:hypothetical protein
VVKSPFVQAPTRFAATVPQHKIPYRAPFDALFRPVGVWGLRQPPGGERICRSEKVTGQIDHVLWVADAQGIPTGTGGAEPVSQILTRLQGGSTAAGAQYGMATPRGHVPRRMPSPSLWSLLQDKWAHIALWSLLQDKWAHIALWSFPQDKWAHIAL